MTRRTRMLKAVRRLLPASIIAVVLVAGADVAPGRGATAFATATLELRADLRFVSQLVGCPPGVAANACADRTGEAQVPGLGRVTEAYTWQARLDAPCAAESGRALAVPVRFVVAGKGEIQFALAEGAQCVDLETLRTQTQTFTITGGTGRYAGASGSGTVERTLGEGFPRRGRETWTGTLAVPGLEFDLAAPTLSGAVAKTVRASTGARRTRVVYAVTAKDGEDGTVPVACTPRSGSRFAIGRTVVTCAATDSSGNTRTGRFAITVRARR